MSVQNSKIKKCFTFKMVQKVNPICLHQSWGHSQGPIPSIIKLQLFRNFYFNVVPMTTCKHCILSIMLVSLMRFRWFFESIFLSKCVKWPLIYLGWSKIIYEKHIMIPLEWFERSYPKIIPKLSPLILIAKTYKTYDNLFCEFIYCQIKELPPITSFRMCHKAIENII